MDTRVKFGKSTTLEIPPASLSSFDTISIIVLILLEDNEVDVIRMQQHVSARAFPLVAIEGG